jgi:hypothetical protein
VQHKSRRGLMGLPEIAKRPSTPIERLAFVRDGITHQAAKQRGAGCVGGIDNWWLESCCGIRVVTTSMARPAGLVDCMACLVMADFPND